MSSRISLMRAAISGCSISASRSSGTAGAPISANLPAIVRATRSSSSDSRRISARIWGSGVDSMLAAL